LLVYPFMQNLSVAYRLRGIIFYLVHAPPLGTGLWLFVMFVAGVHTKE
jgi:hypothetical protein